MVAIGPFGRQASGAIMDRTESATTEAAEKIRRTPYDMVGGEAGLRRLVDRFYEIMDTDPAAAGIRAMHGLDLGPIREKLFEYLSGWLGGPPLYVQRTGRVCLTDPHRPFAIGPAERDQWLHCMHRAMKDAGISEETCRIFEQPLFGIADFVRNRD